VGESGWGWWRSSARTTVDDDADARFVDDVADESPIGFGTRFGVRARVACTDRP
jgi:hypothetical protein